ncbi:hypothetical protein ACETU7_13455 [Rhodococcus sp. 3Y1]
MIATRDVDEIIRSRPQVLIHSPRLQIPYERHDDDLCRLLRAGINVITTAGQHFPAHTAPNASTCSPKHARKAIRRSSGSA